MLRAIGAVFVLTLLLCAGPSVPAQESGWPQADSPREWSFPRDHGAHPEYATEWWYFTGNLEDAAGRPFGYQFTIFRVGVRRELPVAALDNPWAVRDLYLGHLAVTDGAGGKFYYSDRLSRAGPGLAGASTTQMDVWVLGWSARMEDGAIHLVGATGEFGLELSLRPTKPVVLHGDRGRSQKGPLPGQASYYASLTSLTTAGSLRFGPDSEPVEVKGVSWFDQEFGSNQLAEDQAGWDWFSLHLGDGRELMLYQLRRTDGSVEPSSSGTLVHQDGRGEHLALDEFRIEVLDTWESPGTGAGYPGHWVVAVPKHAIRLEVQPIFAEQELVTEGSTGVVYWEGAVACTGDSGPCRGYVELTGYAGELGGLF